MLDPRSVDLQPRVPKGRHDGGQWTRDGLLQDASLASAVSLVIRVGSTVAAALDLFRKLSERNNAHERAVIALNPFWDQPKKVDMRLADIRVLRTREEFDEFCTKLDDVQTALNDAVDDVERERLNRTPQAYGIAVHENLEKRIKSENDPKFRAEVSYHEDFKEKDAPRGSKGSIRVDVLENLGEGRVCVYEIRTRNAELRESREQEIIRKVLAVYPKTREIIVTQVKPTHAPLR